MAAALTVWAVVLAALTPPLTAAPAVDPAGPPHAPGGWDGVGPKFRAHFATMGESFFRCVGGGEVPRGFVNDDYCDCPDGSDEPGTAACASPRSHSLPFPEGWAFQCAESEKSVPHSVVRDGRCDCCDGSDESPDSGCRNVCAENAAREREEREEREKRREMGLRALRLMKGQLDSLKVQLEKDIAAKKVEVEVAQAAVVTAQAALVPLEEAERQEKDRLDADFQKNPPPPVDPPPPFIPKAAHITCISWRQTKECRGRGDRESGADRSCDTRIDKLWSGYCECLNTETSEDVKFYFDCHHNVWNCDEVCGNEGEEPEDFEARHAGPLPPPSNPADHYSSSEASNARHELTNAERKLQDAKSEVERLENELASEHVTHPLYTLSKACIDFPMGEYTYSLCPFQRVEQKKKDGYSSTSMGRWKGFGERSYAMWGSSKHDYSKMHFDQGEMCWSGPHRSTDVTVVCGPSTRVISVDEPSRCVYTMVLETPAICE